MVGQVTTNLPLGPPSFPGLHWKPGVFLCVRGFVLLCSSALVQPQGLSEVALVGQCVRYGLLMRTIASDRPALYWILGRQPTACNPVHCWRSG